MTTLVPNAGRQRVRSAIQKILYSDISSGVAKNIFTPTKNGNLPLSLFVLVKTPFNSGTSDVITIGKALSGGSAASANAYLTSTSIASAAGTRIAATTIPPFVNDVDGSVQYTATVTSVGTAATAGEVWVVQTYIRDGQEDFSEG
jgi:hypothetical protein